MKTQKQIWEDEYKKVGGIPTTKRGRPSSAVVKSIDFLKHKYDDFGKKVIDLGAGTGRNSIYLAKRGYNVMAIEFSKSALNILNKKVNDLKLSDKITSLNASIAEKFPLKDDKFDIALDIVTSISLNLKEIKTFESEVRRVVRRNGFLIGYVLSRDDDYLKDRIDKNGYYIVPEGGMRERAWTKEELLELYKNWKVLKFEKKEKDDTFFGKRYTRRLWIFILQNKKNCL